jgi:flagellar FliL protein
LLVLAAGGGGAAYMMLGNGSGEAGAEADAPTEVAAYVEVPPMTVNLRSADGRARFLKVRFVLVPRKANGEETLKEKLPLILDAFQPFLRELRPEDLAGSAAVFRLKEEMIVRAARVVGPDVVRDVLIQDLIQQ